MSHLLLGYNSLEKEIVVLFLQGQFLGQSQKYINIHVMEFILIPFKCNFWFSLQASEIPLLCGV